MDQVQGQFGMVRKERFISVNTHLQISGNDYGNIDLYHADWTLRNVTKAHILLNIAFSFDTQHNKKKVDKQHEIDLPNINPNGWWPTQPYSTTHVGTHFEL